MKSIFLPALGLAVALAFSPLAGVAAADAAPMHSSHVVHHPKHGVMHCKVVHNKKVCRVVHHKPAHHKQAHHKPVHHKPVHHKPVHHTSKKH